MADLIGGPNTVELENQHITTPKIIIFLVGGIGFNEIRAIRNLENSKK